MLAPRKWLEWGLCGMIILFSGGVSAGSEFYKEKTNGTGQGLLRQVQGRARDQGLGICDDQEWPPGCQGSLPGVRDQDVQVLEGCHPKTGESLICRMPQAACCLRRKPLLGLDPHP